MKNIILLLIAVVTARVASSAQSAVTGSSLAGKVVNSKGGPVPYATVTLLQARDSSLVKGALTSATGVYEFAHIPAGAYLVAASAIGMIKAFSKPFQMTAGGREISMGDLILKDNPQMLHAVRVTAGKPFIQHELDKTVVNVENSIISAGNSAWEILQKSPGVSVDNGTNAIQMQGKSGVAVYIDGKPTHLSRDQLANVLKNMDAGSIKSIEIMTQPSAKYDAAGNAGIINIITRKSDKNGFNGSITAGYTQGRYARENGGANLNYRTGKVNLYGNYDYTHAQWWNDNYITRNFYTGDPKTLSTRSEQYSSHVSPSRSHHFKAGLDYYLNDKNTIGLAVNGAVSPGSSARGTHTLFKNPDGSLQYTSISKNTAKEKWTDFTYDLNYRGRYDSAGRELDVDVAFSRFDNSSLNYFHTNTYFPDNTPFPDSSVMPNPNIRKGSLPSVIDIKTAKIDYALPLHKKAKLEFGAKTSFVTSDNNVLYNRLDNQTGQWLSDAASNHFRYKENINAAYINFNKQFKKGWGIQLGLRGEQTVSEGYQYTNDSTVKKNYFQLFPSVFINKKLDKNNIINLSYSRRIDRPDYQSLNPFRYYLDPYTYEEGNPFLQPQLTHSVKLSYSYKNWLTTSASYSHTSDVMTQVLEQDDVDKITYQTEKNLNTLQNIGLGVTLSLPVTRWWMSNTFINGFDNIYRGEFLGAYLDFSKVAFMAHTTNTFTLPRGFKAELSGYYHSSMQWSIFTIRPQYSVNAGIQKSFMHDKADLKLNVNDLFHTQRSFAAVKYQNLDVTATNHWDSQRVSLTFTWRFNKGNAKPVKHHQSATEEEQKRIKK